MPIEMTNIDLYARQTKYVLSIGAAQQLTTAKLNNNNNKKQKQQQ